MENKITNMQVENEPSFFTTFGFHEHRTPTGMTGREAPNAMAQMMRQHIDQKRYRPRAQHWDNGCGSLHTASAAAHGSSVAGKPSNWAAARKSDMARWHGQAAKASWQGSWARRR